LQGRIEVSTDPDRRRRCCGIPDRIVRLGSSARRAQDEADALVAFIDGLGLQASLEPERLPPRRQRALIDLHLADRSESAAIASYRLRSARAASARMRCMACVS